MTPPPHEVTRLLLRWGDGDRDAFDALTPLVYNELRRLAGRYLRRERSDHTLQSTALVHEAYLKLVDQRNVRWQNRAQFFGLAAEMIRPTVCRLCIVLLWLVLLSWLHVSTY